MKQKVKSTQLFSKKFGIVLVLFLSFWTVKPLFAPGFFPMHDDTQVARVFEMGKALKDGVFPVRWVPDLGYGYGYPIFNFYAPLAYYVGGLFMLLGLDALLATKIMMALGVVLAGVFMYFLAREFFGNLGGVVSGLFYVYAPYHALDIYVRGDVAEFWAYAFIPLAFLGFYKGSILAGSIGFAAIILSHNLTALMVAPFLIIVTLLNCYIAYKKNKLFIIHNSLFIILLGLVFSAFYWIPALLEMKNTNVLSQIGGGADFRDHFVCIGQLWDSAWGFGGSARGCIDGLSFKIGKLHLFSALLTLLILIAYLFNRHPRLDRGSDSRFHGNDVIENKHSNDSNHYSGKKLIISVVILGFVVSVFFTLEMSKTIWEAFPLMEFFQYPWRFLLLASFFSSLLSGFVIWFLQAEKPGLSSYFKHGLWILIFLLISFNSKLFNPQTILNKTAEDYTNEIALKWTASKISDEYLPRNFKKPKSEKDIAKNPIPFKETAVQKASNLVSFIGVLALIIGIIVRYGKTKR